MTGERSVRFRGAGVRLAHQWVWREVDLDIGQGEFVAILGQNGAGKSTLLKAMLGLVALNEGTAEVMGRRVRRGSGDIGYLPQRRRFDPDLRIRAADLVGLGLDGTRWGLPLPFTASGRSRARAVAETLRLTGADAFANRPIGELSGGEQQRVLIAQALVGSPRLLALDEPLDSLDLNNQQAIASLLRELCDERGITVLLVAHDINPILPFVDRVVYLANGGVVTGKPEDVINSETLTRLYGSPVEVLRASDGRMVVVGQQETISYHAHEHDDR